MDVNSSTEAIYENTQELKKWKKEKTKLTFHLLSLGILSVLLLTSIGIIVWMSIDRMKHEEMVKHLDKEKRHLEIKKNILEDVTEQLISERDDLKRGLDVILMYDNFPVNKFCPDKKCLPCQSSWMSFLEKCGIFYNQSSGQNAWKGSLLYCKNASADLVFINDEQNLVSNNEPEFYSLGQTTNNWFWIDGHNESLGFWMTGVVWFSGPYATVIIWWKSTETSFTPTSVWEQVQLLD